MDVNNNNNNYNDGVVDMKVDSEGVVAGAVPIYYNYNYGGHFPVTNEFRAVMQYVHELSQRPVDFPTRSSSYRSRVRNLLTLSGSRGSPTTTTTLRRRYPLTTPPPPTTTTTTEILEAPRTPADYNHRDDQNNNNKDGDDDNNNSNPFECSICLDMARDPIVTCCGHLFCWPCFSRVKKLTTTFGGRRECPVCKGEVKDSAITPVYVNHKTTSRTTTTVPPRPKAQRVEGRKTYF